MGAALDGKFDSHGSLVAPFELLQQRVEMVYGGKLSPYLCSVTVGEVVGRHVTRHNLFSEDIAVALHLLAYACARVAAVEHAGIALVVADGPHHALQNKARERLLTLHEG